MIVVVVEIMMLITMMMPRVMTITMMMLMMTRGLRRMTIAYPGKETRALTGKEPGRS